jgi:hypothetical protein
MSDKLDLNTLSQQLGIKLKPSNSGDLQAQTSQPEAVGIVALEADSQPVETNPLFKMLLLGGVLFGTVGFGLIAMLWGAGDNPQHAKKADTLPKEQVAAAVVDRQKEVADLKASLVMNQQKLDATRLTAGKNPPETPTPTATTTPTTPTTTPTSTPTTVTPTTESQVATRPIAQQSIASATPKPVATMQPSPQDTAQLAALDRAKQEETTQLAALNRAKQQETAQLAALDRAKQQETTQLAALNRAKQQETAQLATLRQSLQQGTNQLAALDRAKQQGTAQLTTLRQSLQQGTGRLATLRQAGQQQATELGGLTDLVKKERQNLAGLRQQRNSTNLAKTQSPLPTRVAQRQTIAANYQRQTIATNDRPPTAPQPKMSWEEASALASYGGQESELTVNGQNGTIQPVNSVVNALATSPLLRLPVGQVVGGRLVTPFYTLIGGSNGQQASQKTSATVTIDKAIEVGSGWSLPAGTAIEFDFQLADNGMIQASSKKVIYGNTQIPMLPGAFVLTGNDNQPLFAQIKEVNSDKLAAADLNSAIFGGAAEVGNVLVNSGNNSSVSIGGGTAISTTNNGNPNILGAIFKGAFSPLTQTQISRSQAIATRLEKQSKVGYLTPGTTMQVYVALAATFQIPTDNPLIQASNPFQTGTSYAPPTRIGLISSRFPADITLSSPPSAAEMPTSTPVITASSNPDSSTPARPSVATPTLQSPSTQPTVTVNSTQGQLVIQSPRGIPVQIDPIQLPQVPSNVRSIFPR